MKWLKSLFYLILIGMASHLFIIMNGLHWLDLYDPSSLLFILAGWLFTLINYPFSEVFKALQESLGFKKGVQSLELSKQILSTMGKYGLLAGGVCSLIGIVQALGNLDDLKALGSAMALSLIGLLYALYFNFMVLLPLQNALQRQLIEEGAFE
jgi:flagellar motor component MotA